MKAQTRVLSDKALKCVVGLHGEHNKEVYEGGKQDPMAFADDLVLNGAFGILPGESIEEREQLSEKLRGTDEEAEDILFKKDFLGYGQTEYKKKKRGSKNEGMAYIGWMQFFIPSRLRAVKRNF